jgi:hypothetical protein
MSLKQITTARKELLPLIAQTYVLGFEELYGKDVQKWPRFSRQEFSSLSPFNLSKDYKIIGFVRVRHNVIPFGDGNKKKIALALMLEKEGVNYLVYRGSLSAYDWYNDLLFLQKQSKNSPDEQAHTGFLELHYEIENQLRKFDFVPDIITGHSLGGALATLSLRFYDNSDIQLYTFGSPRVGDKKFANNTNIRFKKIYRFENTFDIVTALPPQKVMTGFPEYKHVGRLIKINSGLEEIRNYSDLGKPEVLLSHLPSAYLKALDYMLKLKKISLT